MDGQADQKYQVVKTGKYEDHAVIFNWLLDTEEDAQRFILRMIEREMFMHILADFVDLPELMVAGNIDWADEVSKSIQVAMQGQYDDYQIPPRNIATLPNSMIPQIKLAQFDLWESIHEDDTRWWATRYWRSVAWGIRLATSASQLFPTAWVDEGYTNSF